MNKARYWAVVETATQKVINGYVTKSKAESMAPAGCEVVKTDKPVTQAAIGELLMTLYSNPFTVTMGFAS